MLQKEIYGAEGSGRVAGSTLSFVGESDMRRMDFKNFSVQAKMCRMELINVVHYLLIWFRRQFWHHWTDWNVASDKSNMCMMLIDVYNDIIEYYHKPKIRRLKQAIVLHNYFVEMNPSMQCRPKNLRGLLLILDQMLSQHVETHVLVACGV